MPISSRVLGEDEEVLVDLRPHWLFLSGPVVLLAVVVAVAAVVTVEVPDAPVWAAYVLAVVVGIPLIWLILRAVRWAAISLIVTTNRLIYRRGVLGRDMVQLRLTRVSEVHCRQRLFERVLGSGSLVVDLLGEDPVTVIDVRRVRLVQRVIYEQMDLLERAPVMAEAPNQAGVPSLPVQVTAPPALAATPPHGTLAIGPGGTAQRPRGPEGAASIHEQLVQLDDLRRRGIVSDQEFQSKKTELLSRL
ncbi:MAG: PH domain-containing protein [Acidimicrobiales bacterium]